MYIDPNWTPAQTAAYHAQQERFAALNKQAEAATKEAQGKCDDALSALAAKLEELGVGTYINPTGERGGGMYYEPTQLAEAFEYDAEGLAIPRAPSSWEASDASGWMSSSSNC